MGGRRSGSFRAVRGSSQRTRKAVYGLNTTLRTGAASSAVVGAAIGVLAASGPVGGAIATGITVASAVSGIYADTNRAMKKGEGLPAALGTAIVKSTAEGAATTVAGQIVQAAVPMAIRATGVPVSPGARKLITAAISGAVSGS